MAFRRKKHGWKPPRGFPSGATQRVGRTKPSARLVAEWNRRKREWTVERAHKNSGVFIALDDYRLPDFRWEAEIERKLERARVTLREIRAVFLAGKEMPSQKVEAAILLQEKLGLEPVRPDPLRRQEVEVYRETI